MATNTYQAYCTTCSWVGRSFTKQSDAENDADEHELAIADDNNIRDHHYADVRESLPKSRFSEEEKRALQAQNQALSNALLNPKKKS